MDLNARLVDARVWRQRFVFFSVVFDHAYMCVNVFPWRSALYFFASVAFFLSLSADNKETGNGFSRQPQLRAERSSQPITVTLSCEGCNFFVSSASWFIFRRWPISACLAVEAQMRQLGEGCVCKEDKLLRHHISSSGSDLIYILLSAFSDCFAWCLPIASCGLSQITPSAYCECPTQTAFNPHASFCSVNTLVCWLCPISTKSVDSLQRRFLHSVSVRVMAECQDYQIIYHLFSFHYFHWWNLKSRHQGGFKVKVRL